MSESAGGGFLTIEELIKRQETDKIFEIDGYENKEIFKMLQDQEKENVIVVDLALGDEYFLSSGDVPRMLDSQQKHLVIEPGDFALLTTLAKFDIPLDTMAFISMRFRHSLRGLVNISGFHVDPGYKGRIIFSVYNAGPNRIVFERNESVFMMMFSKIGKKVDLRKDKKFHGINRIMPEHISGLSGIPVSPQSMNKRLNKLENWNKIYLALAIALGGAIFTTIMDLIFKFIPRGS